MEGHTLLTGEQLSPYANKDIELVCGSLLTVRDETIQVSHLTVKEFLEKTALTDATDSYAQILVDPTSASLQLTLVCLKYMSRNFTEPIVDLGASTTFADKDNRSDAFGKMRLKDRLELCPFTEYASFNWLIHLVDCDGVGGYKVVEAFRSAFDSKATFCWIEMCLTLDPRSFGRIRVGLEDVLDWARDTTDSAPYSFSQYSFLQNWCSTILCVIVDIGPAFRPEDIYRLDFSKIFFSNSLGGTYNDHGHFAAREIRTYYDNIQKPFEVKANLQLKTMPIRRSEKFIHDYTRDVFFVAASPRESKHRALIVQDVKTGRRLPPVLDPERDRYYYVMEFEMSGDGRYVAILYWSLFDYTTVIWQIDFRLDFKKRMRSNAWAHEVFRGRVLRGVGASILWADDGYICSPAGQVYPATGTVVPFPQVLRHRYIHFNTKGNVFCQKDDDESRVMGYSSIQDPEVMECYTIPKSRLTAVGPTGRYLLLAHRDLNRYSLYDTTSRESSIIPQITFVPQTIDEWPLKVFKFLEDENRLFCFSSNKVREYDGSLEAWVMDLSGRTPQIRSHGKRGPYGSNDVKASSRHLYICTQKEIVWLVEGGAIHPVDLSTPEIVFPTFVTETQDFPLHVSQISPDGMNLSILHYGKSNSQAYVQHFNFNRPEQLPRQLHLAESETSNLYPPVQFSEDATIVVYGANVYHLRVPNLDNDDYNDTEEQLPVPVAIEIQPIPVGNIDDLNFNRAEDPFPRIMIGHDSHYVSVAYYPSWSNTLFSLYRVDLNLRSSVQIEIPPLFDDSVAFIDYNSPICFHPSLRRALSACSKTNKDYVSFIMLDQTDPKKASVREHRVVLSDFP